MWNTTSNFTTWSHDNMIPFANTSKSKLLTLIFWIYQNSPIRFINQHQGNKICIFSKWNGFSKNFCNICDSFTYLKLTFSHYYPWQDDKASPGVCLQSPVPPASSPRTLCPPPPSSIREEAPDAGNSSFWGGSLP